MDEILELVSYIDEFGVALDDYGNEVRQEDGSIIVVPQANRKFFTVLNRTGETE